MSPDDLRRIDARVRALLPSVRDGRDGADGEDGRPGAPGRDGAKGQKGERGERGLRGDAGAPGRDGAPGLHGKDGERGPRGFVGPMPDHEWKGKKLRFEKPDGSWGEYTDLEGPKGEPGRDGMGGGVIVRQGGGGGFSYFPGGWS